MSASPCIHCGQTETDPVLGLVDTILHCGDCGHPVCQRCGDCDIDGEGRGVVVCRECPDEHAGCCECSECMATSALPDTTREYRELVEG